MRNKKSKGDGGAAAAANATTSPSGASNTSCFLQVVGLGTDTGDAVPGALLFFDRRRLLFNSGEGLQRFAIEHGLKLAKLSDVLLTRLTPDAAGGLPGLCLSTAEARGGGSRALCANNAANAAAAAAGGGFGYGNIGSGSNNNTPIRVFGPQGLAQLVGALRTFVDTSVQAVEAVEFPSDSSLSSSSIPSSSSLLPPVIEDDDVRVVPIVVSLEEQTEEKEKEGNGNDDPAAAAGASPPAPKRARLEAAAAAAAAAGGAKSSSSPYRLIPAVCYACELASIPGKFKPEAALALGVPRGPLWGRLKSGQSVEVLEGSDGIRKTVNPDQVAEASLPGPVALIIDCPSEEHARAMARSPAFGRWSKKSSSSEVGGGGRRGGGEEEEAGEAFARLAVVLHLTPDPAVVASEGYAALCRRFDGGGSALASGVEAAEKDSRTTATTRHVFANGAATNGATILSSSAALAARLNAVNSKLFPLHKLGAGEEEEEEEKVATTTSGLVLSAPSPCSAVAGGNLLRFHLRPASRLGCDASSVPPPLSVSEIQAELRGAHGGILEEASRAAEEATAAAATEEEATAAAAAAAATAAGASDDGHPPRTPSLPESRRGEAELVFLGTGAAAPSKYRNVTGTLLRLRKRRSKSSGPLPAPAGGLLLDCGEGSLGQLTRAFGREGALEAVESLELIWISHIHADHHAGLPRLLMARARGVVDGEEQEEEEEKGPEEATTTTTTTTTGAAVAAGTKATPLPPPIIPILGPRPLRRVLAAYEVVCGGPGSLRYEFFDNGDIIAAASETAARAVAEAAAAAAAATTQSSSSSLLPPLVSRAMVRLGLGKLLPVRVLHCAHSFGLIVEQEESIEVEGGAATTTNGNDGGDGCKKTSFSSPPPIKISFSGDTRRCPALELAARGSHLLVHEATFEDGLEGEALAKNHSTTSDAVSTGKGAGVAATLLTHFSQRYPKVPAVDVEQEEQEEEEEKEEKKNEKKKKSNNKNNVGVAFDLLQVDVVDAATLLPALTRPLRRLFDALEGGGGGGGGGSAAAGEDD